MANKLFIFGIGYSALALAEKCMERGWQVSGSVRSGNKASTLRAKGIRAFAYEGGNPSDELINEVQSSPYILQSIGLAEGKDPILPFFDSYIASRRRKWVGYLSTTVVYGNHDGGLVDETTTPRPTTDRGKARLAAENAWAQLPVPIHIFRLAGIYGQGRNILLKIQQGKARTIHKPNQVFSRIHVEDIAKLLLASMNAPAAKRGLPEIYNVADTESAAPEVVAAFAAKLLGIKPPPLVPFEAAEMSEMASSFYQDNKRVSSAKMLKLIGEFTYPTYREGLRAIKQSLHPR